MKSTNNFLYVYVIIFLYIFLRSLFVPAMFLNSILAAEAPKAQRKKPICNQLVDIT